MSSDGKNNSGSDFDSSGGDGALHDPVLRRALDHAPDSGAMPDPRTRDAIRKMAHNLAPVPATVPVAAAPWWRRWLGGGETHARMPWNAAFATVLVATFVTVLWYREPVPDARLDGEARVGDASAPAPAPAPVQAPSPAGVAQAPQASVSEAAPPMQTAPPTAESVRRSALAPSGKETAAAAPEDVDRKASEPPPAPVVAPAPAPAPELAAVPPPMPASPAVAPKVAPPPSVAEQSAAELRAFSRAEERRSSESERDRLSGHTGGAPAIAAAPPAAPMASAGPPPMQREPADTAPGLSAQRRADAEPSAALRQAPAPRAAAAAKAASPQDDTSVFSALDRWTSFNHVRAGQGMRHTRGDVEGLAALVNTVARSATLPGGDLEAPVEARLELYRGTTLLAVLEIAGDQVRWTPQAGGRPSVGSPPASALAALRALLTRQ